MSAPSPSTATTPAVGHEPLLTLDRLTVEYQSDTRVIRGADEVSFTIGRGEAFGLAGESGCGKSTIANAVMRLLKPPAKIVSGSIQFGDVDLLALTGEALREFRWTRMAMVFQSAMNALNPVMTVGDQIVDAFTAHGRATPKVARDKAGDLLTLVGIPTDRLASYPHQLSGGMRQRVVIAIALALDPDLLILDEPTTALDVVVQQEIMQQIQSLRSEFGFSLLFITHDISLMIELTDRMGVMYNGRIVEMAPSAEVFAEPLHPYTRALMGSFPPLHGPRRRLTGLADRASVLNAADARERLGFDPLHIPDLTEVRPGRFVADPAASQETSTRGTSR
ncbi:MAG: ABC transporter ATP-binding protein [Corynebacterium sp.]|uniref:ABC transporter ATP-binding protein n=1 Tax=Corynebacterium sp. TaxID=1720 RepID=UPI0026E0ABB7|nr:ABC transporter ATP-binding protein [Corynebacterium sp.]MDO5670128.1 ABC transporter ATP-binding protein [Corynebacterium sp.]